MQFTYIAPRKSSGVAFTKYISIGQVLFHGLGVVEYILALVLRIIKTGSDTSLNI